MGEYLNPGNIAFQEALNSEIYVDKSGLIAKTNAVLRTQDKYVCVSRPRRFGKTIAANMLCAYYGAGCDSASQFDNLAVAQSPGYADHLNKYNVIHVNIQNMLRMGGNTIAGLLECIESEIIFEIEDYFPDVRFPSHKTLASSISRVFSATGMAFVFVFDEWDCIFRVKGIGADDQREYLDWLRALLKDRTYVALAYLTGILPIKKYGEHSALNMFTEISMTNAWPYQAYTGFTHDEVVELCERYGRNLEPIAAWYDGYQVNDERLYNPRSAVMAIRSGINDNYWTMTETFSALRDYIVMDFAGLHGTVAELVGGAHVPVDTTTFQNDMTSLQSADDVLTLLIHLGYLTFEHVEGGRGACWVPNREVAEQFESCLEQGGWSEVVAAIHASNDLMAATLAGDAAAVARGIQKAHQDNTSIIAYNNENALASVLGLAYYAARRTHMMYREMPAGKGFADVVFVPRPTTAQPAVVVELKWDDSAQTALDQIRRRDYPACLEGYEGNVVLVGISYQRDTKEHTCVIEMA